MKKLLAILVSICLVAVSGLSVFALPSPDEYTIFDQANDIIDFIILDGAKSDDEILDAADNLYNDTYIDQDVYNEIYRIIENGLREEDVTDGPSENEDIIAEITDIINDDSLDIGAKVSKIVEILRALPGEQIQSVLDDLLAADVIDDATYTAISDALNGSSSILGGIDTGDGSPISGIGDFLSGILGMLGIGGGDSPNENNGGTPSNPTTPTDSNPNSSDFEGGNSKTGDYAVASVAGVAVVAGLALVLTHAKKDENND